MGSGALAKTPHTVAGGAKNTFVYSQKGDADSYCQVGYKYEDGSGCFFQIGVDPGTQVIYANFIENFLTVQCSTQTEWPNTFLGVRTK